MSEPVWGPTVITEPGDYITRGGRRVTTTRRTATAPASSTTAAASGPSSNKEPNTMKPYAEHMLDVDGLYAQARRTAAYRRHLPLVTSRVPPSWLAKLSALACFALFTAAACSVWAHTGG